MSIITYVPAPGYSAAEQGVINVGGGISFNIGSALASGSGVITVDSNASPLLVDALDHFPGVIRQGVTPGPVSVSDIIGPVLSHSLRSDKTLPQSGDALVRGSDGLYMPQLGNLGSNPLASDRVYYAALPPYSVKADGRTVTDAAITAGTNQLSSASANFARDQLAVVIGAGTPISTTTTAGLTNGAGLTSLAVNALPNAIPPGGVIISSGANSQGFVTPGAAIGATSIPLIGKSLSAINTALSTGGPITSLAVGKLQIAIPAGTVTLVTIPDANGVSHVQTFSTTGAAVGATAIPVTSQTPNFAYPAGTPIYGNPISVNANFSYPIGSTVSTPVPALSTTIVSVSGGVATLAANAGTTVTGAECFYATDDTVGAQNCLNDANAAQAVAEFPNGDMGLSATLTTNSSQDITVQGQGIHELYGGTTQFNDADFPTIPPYMRGTVFVQCAPFADGLQVNGQGVTQHVRRFGIRFAGRYVNTGHGINRTPIGGKLGLMGNVLEDVHIFGHDGNHYGDRMDSQLMSRCVGFRSFGGGGIWLSTNPSCPGPPGPSVFIDQFSQVYIGGLAHGGLIDASPKQYFDYCLFEGVTHVVSTPNPALPGLVGPTIAQQVLQTFYTGTQLHLAMGWDLPIFESNISSPATFPTGPACYRTNDPTVAPLGNPTMPTNPASGTAYQNLTGVAKTGHFPILLTPAAAATAAGTLAAQANAGANSISVTVTSGTFSAGQGIQIVDASGTVEFGVISSVSGAGPVTINLVESAGFGLGLTHASGATVQAGAAVVIAQNSSNGNFPGTQKLDWIGAEIGAHRQQQTVKIPIPSGWYYRLDFANATLIWGDYSSSLG